MEQNMFCSGISGDTSVLFQPLTWLAWQFFQVLCLKQRHLLKSCVQMSDSLDVTGIGPFKYNQCSLHVTCRSHASWGGMGRKRSPFFKPFTLVEDEKIKMVIRESKAGAKQQQCVAYQGKNRGAKQ